NYHPCGNKTGIFPGAIYIILKQTVFNSGVHVLSCTVFVKKNFLCKEFCIIAARNSWRQI
ncbi:hypothetical protein ACQ9PR_26415, partial [Escherichia coli]